MSSYVTRAERAGSIFFRVTGLIRSGQIEWAERPLWYDVYISHPPLTAPVWNVKLPKHDEPIRPIFYQEDTTRASFYKKYHNSSAVNILQHEDSPCQQFIKEYNSAATENPTKESSELFALTEKRLEEIGQKVGARPIKA